MPTGYAYEPTGFFIVNPKKGCHLRIGTRSLGWFSLETNRQCLKVGLSAALIPEHVGNKLGLRVFEPLIGWEGGGAKLEEILMVDPSGCHWLDDGVPSVVEQRRKR